MSRARLSLKRFGLVLVSIGLVGAPTARAETKPLQHLPADVASVSLAWVALPQAMAEVTQEQGLFAGLSWGALKGSSDAVRRVLRVVDQDSSRPRPTPDSGGQGFLQEDRRLAWLNPPLEDARGTSRQEPAWLRYAF